jgi:hypothetical protein
MHTFKDNMGREWSIDFTLTTLNRIKGKGFHLFEGGKVTIVQQLYSDYGKLFEFLWLLCQKQAEQMDPKVTQDDFGEALAGDAIAEATKAVLEAITDFFPNQERREAIKAAIETVDRRTLLAIDHVQKRPELNKTDEQFLEELDAVLNREMQTSSAGPTKPPASSESTQED